MTKKHITLVGIAIAVLIGSVLLCPWTIVSSGTVKVATKFGKVMPTVYTEGFHIVDPRLSFDTYDTKEQIIELNDISIPSRDKFKSNADVTIIYSIKSSETPRLRGQVGTEKDVVYKVVRQPILSLLREAGRNVEKAQDLFNADTQNRLQEEIVSGMKNFCEPYGVTIHNVLLKDITLPEVITTAIIKTKKLEEAEAQQKATLKTQALQFERQVKQAESNARAAAEDAKARKAQVDANFYAQKKIADARLYDAEKQAEANRKLNKSLTPAILEAKRLEVDMERAKRWQGGVPQTVVSGGKDGVNPVLFLGQK